MPNRDDCITLRQMLDHAREAVDLIRGKNREDLDKERLLSLALIQLSQIVGEAAVRVSQTTQFRHPEIPWPKIIAFRNRLIHGYDVIDCDIFWKILTTDLPALIPALEKILRDNP